MKQCPNCQSQYTDDTVQFCLTDGTPLQNPSVSQMPTLEFGKQATIGSNRQSNQTNAPRETQPTNWQPNQIPPVSGFQPPAKKSNLPVILIGAAFVLLLFFGAVGVGAWLYLKNAAPDNNGNSSLDKKSPNSTNTPTTSADEKVEKPKLSDQQQSILDGADEVKWDDQGISWKLPKGWSKMDVKKESFMYGSPKTGFLIGTISTMAANFPSDISLKGTYDSSLEKLKNGKYENARYLEIDGVKGVEWVETMPEDKSGPRRHQWIAFRNYQGQNQQLNIILSTKGNEFEKQRDTFAAILYSMKIAK